MPRISVAVPVHNGERFIGAALQSILEQKGCDFEIIVIDDGSADRTREIVTGFASPSIRYTKLDVPHGGPSRPRNLGVRLAAGEYVAFLDADDLMLPGRLQAAVKFLDECPEAALVFSDGRKFDEASGRELGNFLQGYDVLWQTPWRDVGEGHRLIRAKDAFRALFHEQFILPSGVTARRSVLLAAGLFDESLTNGDDLDLWYRLTRHHAIGFIPDSLFRYRIRDGSISNNVAVRGARLFENRIRVVQKQLATGLPVDLMVPARAKLANLYGCLGYFYRTQAEMRQAQICYFRALNGRFSLGFLRGYFLSLLHIPPRSN